MGSVTLRSQTLSPGPQLDSLQQTADATVGPVVVIRGRVAAVGYLLFPSFRIHPECARGRATGSQSHGERRAVATFPTGREDKRLKVKGPGGAALPGRLLGEGGGIWAWGEEAEEKANRWCLDLSLYHVTQPETSISEGSLGTPTGAL